MALLDKSGTLPMIKCSNCGLDINIDKLADHLCNSGESTGRQTPRNFNDAFSNMSVNQFVPAPFRQKPIPRPIDSRVANVPFGSRPGAPTGLPTFNRTESPITTIKNSMAPQRTAPLPVRPPSPKLMLPQGSAFPPFPISRKPAPNNPSTEIPSNIPGHAPRGTDLHNGDYNKFTANPYAQFLESSAGSEGASTPITSMTQPPLLFNQTSATSGTSTNTPPMPTNPTNPPSTDASEPASERRPSHSRNKSVAAAIRPLDEIGSFRTHKPMPSRTGVSAISSPHEITRSASAQSHRYNRSTHENAPPIPGSNNTAGYSIPRSASASGARDRQIYDTPPVPTHPRYYQPESPGRNRHTPRDSNSSNQSEHSHPATSSSQSSPPTSHASMSPQRRDRQEDGRLYATAARGLGLDGDRPAEKTSPRSFSRPSYSQPKLPLLSPDTFETLSAGPWQSEAKKNFQQPKPLNIDTAQYSNGPYRDNPPQAPAPESPMDPALNGNKLPTSKMQRLLPTSVSDYRNAPQSATMPDTRNNKVFHDSPASEYPDAPRSAIMPDTRKNNVFQDPLAPSLMPRTALHRAATTSKGKCRGCGEFIVGKSVSSADGRLTGRWHKQCFTCKTCSGPFPTMDFYVIGNDPYCNRHYHQLNKSLCASCDRGIEGQYVDNNQQKFHPHCFTCRECHLILRETYFDLNGKIFCERHAFKFDAMPPYGGGGGGGRRFPEKRSTRFMMI